MENTLHKQRRALKHSIQQYVADEDRLKFSASDMRGDASNRRNSAVRMMTEKVYRRKIRTSNNEQTLKVEDRISLGITPD